MPFSDPMQATNGLAPSTPLAMLASGCAWLRAASRLPIGRGLTSTPRVGAAKGRSAPRDDPDLQSHQGMPGGHSPRPSDSATTRGFQRGAGASKGLSGR